LSGSALSERLWPGTDEAQRKMLIQPEIPHRSFVRVLRSYGLKTGKATFLPSGDANSAVYCVEAGAIRYFLKSRHRDFDEIAATVPSYLHSQGIVRVMAPIPAITGRPWIHAEGFEWMLYPFFEGKTGLERPLSQANWIALGETMRLVHATILPPDIARRVPQISYSPRYRDIVRALDKAAADSRTLGDPLAAQVAEFWAKHRGNIRTVVERVGQLAEEMRGRAGALVLCHSDLHAGNVLVGTDDALTVVDWDNPVFAPKERDLMFVGGGIGGAWNDPRESGWFFTGYGSAESDPIAIAFFRYERIVVDIAEYGQRIFDLNASASDRLSNLRKLATAFRRDNVVDTAHKYYSSLP
jgi:spectinomycin phosphotransferase